MNNAELIVATLKQAGVSHGLGIPSGNVLPLMEAMRAGGIQFILTAHEGSAGFAAEVMGRLTDSPGLAIATLGPGATNLATGVGSAYLDRSPMVAVTCTLPTDQARRRRQMQIDHQALFGPITKFSTVLGRGGVAAGLQTALHLAMTEPMGPVHLDLPEDVASAEATEEVPDLLPATELPPPTNVDLTAAAEALAIARFPIAVIGANARRMNDPARLLSFVERHKVPFASTTMAKGLIDENHPLSVGCIERGCRQIQRRFLARADLIIGLGYDMVEVEYEAWIGSTPLLNIDIEPGDFEPSVALRGQVVGNLDAALDVLIERPVADIDWAPEEIADHRAVLATALRPASKGFAPSEVIDIVHEKLPDGGILAFDVGAHTHQIAAQWLVTSPATFLITNGWSSMGFGLPAAIAAKIAHPDVAVVCILGDGCFQMTCGELAVARRLGLTIPVIVLDDGWLGLMKVKQERNRLPIYATELREASAIEVPTHYFGVPAVGVRNGEDLAKALRDAFRQLGPTVIEAQVDVEQYDATVFD